MLKTCFFLLLSFWPAFAFAQTDLYLIKDGQLPYAGRTQYSVNVVVEGKVSDTRDFFQSFMKDAYHASFRSSLVSLLNLKNNSSNGLLTAKQVSGIGISSRPVDLYAAFTMLTDSTTEVAMFGGFGEKTFISPDLTSSEYKKMRAVLEKYAPAARTYYYRRQVAEAEAKVAAIDKEKEKLNKAMQTTRDNTAANLKRIEELLGQNKTNAQKLSQDSTQLVGNAQLREVGQAEVERRRERLSGVEKK
ncbi:hypothetical protein [Hymenobacter psoromatis]|uniref:hypothetical protein n=1 Tax=Hymenobacter psoromatis TaxID=1484116 RepID=UPI001CBF8AA2|nr:hypothetical protein [Hymenobacter psoromatis]